MRLCWRAKPPWKIPSNGGTVYENYERRVGGRCVVLLLERAQEAEELSVALQAIREARDNLELLAKLLDELDER